MINCLQAAFLGVGSAELVLVLVVALILLGPRELPKIARTMGKFMAQLRSVSEDFNDQIMRIGDDLVESPPSQPVDTQPVNELPATASPCEDQGPAQADLAESLPAVQSVDSYPVGELPAITEPCVDHELARNEQSGMELPRVEGEGMNKDANNDLAG